MRHRHSLLGAGLTMLQPWHNGLADSAIEKLSYLTRATRPGGINLAHGLMGATECSFWQAVSATLPRYQNAHIGGSACGYQGLTASWAISSCAEDPRSERRK
jgi:hypothetical protein